MGPLFMTRRRRDTAVVEAVKALQYAAEEMAEIGSRIGHDDVGPVTEAMIRYRADQFHEKSHALKVAIADLAGFGPDECVDDADEFRGSLVDSYRGLIEGRRPVEGLVEADVLTPSLMAAE